MNDIVKAFENRLAALDGENLEDVYRDFIRMVRGNGALTDRQAYDMLLVIVDDAREFGDV